MCNTLGRFGKEVVRTPLQKCSENTAAAAKQCKDTQTDSPPMNYMQFYYLSKRSKIMAKASLGVVVGVFAVGQEMFTRSLRIMYLKKKTALQ